MEFQPKCSDCNVGFRLEKKAALIVDTYREAPVEEEDQARKVAVGQVSTMTQEGRQIGCPLEKVLKLRREALREISPELEERDRRARALTAPATDPADTYFRERRFYDGETYAQWQYRTSAKGNRS